MPHEGQPEPQPQQQERRTESHDPESDPSASQAGEEVREKRAGPESARIIPVAVRPESMVSHDPDEERHHQQAESQSPAEDCGLATGAVMLREPPKAQARLGGSVAHEIEFNRSGAAAGHNAGP